MVLLSALFGLLSMHRHAQASPAVPSHPILPFSLDFGVTTLTHYDLPIDYVASCGCVARSTHYPTAAVNALVYGSTTSFGRSCGVCYRLRLLSTPFSPLPPLGDGTSFEVNDSGAPSVTVKLTDLCPLGGQWCSQSYDQTTNVSTPNSLGSMIHFDLAWPSKAISSSFYPLDATRADYGVWTATYEKVDCGSWAGYPDAGAWGSDWSQQDAACCPMCPTAFNGSSLPDHVAFMNASAQHSICPSYDSIKANVDDNSQQLVPNTSNILSKSTLVNTAIRPSSPSLLFAPLITGIINTLS